jgi:hypothetical protein
MNTAGLLETRTRPALLARRIAVFICLAWFSVVPAARSAESGAPSSAAFRIGGIYKITSSNDPLFQVTPTREHFLDFGHGARQHLNSGSVSVSQRENPSVRVRMMAWEYFPERGLIALGNPFEPGSRKAVAAGVWRVQWISGGLVWQRGNHRIVLHRPKPGDY